MPRLLTLMTTPSAPVNVPLAMFALTAIHLRVSVAGAPVGVTTATARVPLATEKPTLPEPMKSPEMLMPSVVSFALLTSGGPRIVPLSGALGLKRPSPSASTSTVSCAK